MEFGGLGCLSSPRSWDMIFELLPLPEQRRFELRRREDNKNQTSLRSKWLSYWLLKVLIAFSLQRLPDLLYVPCCSAVRKQCAGHRWSWRRHLVVAAHNVSPLKWPTFLQTGISDGREIFFGMFFGVRGNTCKLAHLLLVPLCASARCPWPCRAVKTPIGSVRCNSAGGPSWTAYFWSAVCLCNNLVRTLHLFWMKILLCKTGLMSPQPFCRSALLVIVPVAQT